MRRKTIALLLAGGLILGAGWIATDLPPHYLVMLVVLWFGCESNCGVDNSAEFIIGRVLTALFVAVAAYHLNRWRKE